MQHVGVCKHKVLLAYMFFQKHKNLFTKPHGYFGSICASDFGVCVPVISVQTVPLFTVRFVPL